MFLLVLAVAMLATAVPGLLAAARRRERFRRAQPADGIQAAESASPP
jgi:hypothetical protein